MNREIKGQDYGVEWIPETGTVFFHGILRLMGHNEYAPIADLLNEAAQHSDTTTLDLQKLDFLNSAGINIFYRFIIQMRDAEQTRQVGHKGVKSGNLAGKVTAQFQPVDASSQAGMGVNHLEHAGGIVQSNRYRESRKVQWVRI